MDKNIFKPGYIFGCKQNGGLGAIASRIFSPKTDRYHFGIIGEYNELFNDYSIVESMAYGLVMKGVCHGWLSNYIGKDLEIYKVTEKNYESLGDYVYWNTLNFQNVTYDVGLFFKLPFGLLKCYINQIIHEHSFRRIEVEELPYIRDKKLVCTEMANEAWWTFNYPIITPGVAAIPAAYKRAEQIGKIERVYKGNLTDI